MDCSTPGKNTPVAYHALLQGIFPSQGSNPCLLFAGRLFTIWATREAWSSLKECHRINALNNRKIFPLPFNMTGLSYLLFFNLAFTSLPHPKSSSLIMEKQSFLFSVAVHFICGVFPTLVRSNSATQRTRSQVSRICSIPWLINVSVFYMMVAGCYVYNV